MNSTQKASYLVSVLMLKSNEQCHEDGGLKKESPYNARYMLILASCHDRARVRNQQHASLIGDL